MNRPRIVTLATGLVLAAFAGTRHLTCAPEETPAAPAGAGAKAPPAVSSGQASPADPAGMVRFPGGKVKIGMSRKALEDLIKDTELGRKSNMQKTIENEYSLSCPEWEVTLPPFWIGKYEVTCAQWSAFLHSPGIHVVHVIPEKGKPGEATLEEIARRYLLSEPFKFEGADYFPAANDWRTIYELNEKTLNPVVEGQDPKSRPAPDTFRKQRLAPGTKISTFRWSVPTNWRAKPGASLQDTPPAWMEELPVTAVSWSDAMAFANFYGCHLPTELEWEAACRGPKGEIWPEGGTSLDPLGHVFKFFNGELVKAQEEAKKKLEGARKAVAEATPQSAAQAQAQAVLDRFQWVLAARELPENQCTIVGNFPYGRSPCGAMDMIGNVDEWVSTRLFLYPGSDTKSDYAQYDALVLRGGNYISMDSLLTATYRCIINQGKALMAHRKFDSAGFRVARYEAPGASAASMAIPFLQASNPPILPRQELKNHELTGPNLDPSRAAGIACYMEAPWTSTQPAKNDPVGKVFLLGPSRSLCVLPANGTPHKDPAAIKEAAGRNAVPAQGTEGADKRNPRDIPFLGLLHMTKGVSIKGEMKVEKWVDVPLTEKEMKALRDAAKEAKKRKAEADKAKEDPPKDDPKNPPPPDKKKMVPPSPVPEGKPGGKGGVPKGGAKPADPKADPNAPNPDETDPNAEDPEDGETKIPTTRKVMMTGHELGFLKGDAYPNGLLLGFVKIGGEARAALWEPRLGTVGSMAPGGTVLLEAPLLILPKDSIDFKKAGKVGTPSAQLVDETKGDVTMVFYVPVEGKDSNTNIEVTLKLVADFSPDWKGGAWVSQSAGPPVK